MLHHGCDGGEAPARLRFWPACASGRRRAAAVALPVREPGGMSFFDDHPAPTPDQRPGGEARVVRATREIDAEPGRVFELIADPAQQPRWNGNDNLSEAASGQRVHAVGDMFVMSLTNGKVRENHVVEFQEGRRIAWKPAEPGREPPGHCWVGARTDRTVADAGHPRVRLDAAHRRAAVPPRPRDDGPEARRLARAAGCVVRRQLSCPTAEPPHRAPGAPAIRSTAWRARRRQARPPAAPGRARRRHRQQARCTASSSRPPRGHPLAAGS